MQQKKGTQTLSPRLLAAAQMLPLCECAADIGCDHGKLAAFLLEQGRCRRVIAADVSAPSLEKAKSLALARGWQQRMETRLGDGLTVLRPGEAQCAILAGMGGLLIAQLLEEGKEAARSMEALVLQPMQHGDRLRRFLRQNDFCIADERLIREKQRIYELILVRPGKQQSSCPQLEDLAGPILLQRRDPLLGERLQRRRRELQSSLEAAGQGASFQAREACRQMEEELGLIEQALEKLQEKRGPSIHPNE
jgi:tRNA (adenine22-N1)-methyltransferase